MKRVRGISIDDRRVFTMNEVRTDSSIRSFDRLADAARWFLPIAIALALAGCAGAGGGKAGSSSRTGVGGVICSPAEGVYVYVYRKGADPYGPADVILPAPTFADGTYSVELPPGEYTLVARRRSNQDSAGPLSAGDQRSDPVDVTVAAGGIARSNLVLNVKEDSGLRSFVPPKEWSTIIAGTVKDADGKPLAGARVHVYTYVQMSERPKYVSERTGPDGRYAVFLPKGGTYYLAARDRFGGPPRIGDLYGRFDEGSINPMGVVVRDGEKREGIDISVFRVW
ncbi:MAG: carboxypeptidase regulatory-like domain-containing protein [Deltaproteobacteria bacterium]|nr:MAG: carboxypeptidase regulatory-like domain-containing protein [Deltaproteobacteria bacterium]